MKFDPGPPFSARYRIVTLAIYSAMFLALALMGGVGWALPDHSAPMLPVRSLWGMAALWLVFTFGAGYLSRKQIPVARRPHLLLRDRFATWMMAEAIGLFGLALRVLGFGTDILDVSLLWGALLLIVCSPSRVQH
jgi:hypothetical protein